MRSDQNQDQLDQSMWNVESDPFASPPSGVEPLFPIGPRVETKDVSETVHEPPTWHYVPTADHGSELNGYDSEAYESEPYDSEVYDVAPEMKPVEASEPPAVAEPLETFTSPEESVPAEASMPVEASAPVETVPVETMPYRPPSKFEKGRPTPDAPDSVQEAPQAEARAAAVSAHQANVSAAQGSKPEADMQFGKIFDTRFAVVTDLIQHGAWPQALEKLRALYVDYPQVPFLAGMVDEAMLKAELMETWSETIKGRRLTVGQEWLLRRSLPFVLILILFLGVATFYQSFVAPSRQVLAMEQANQSQVEEALGMIQMGKYEPAIGLLEEVLARDPENGEAQQGLTSARTQQGLAGNYDLALEVAEAGDLTRAIALLEGIEAQSPSFRDVDKQIDRLNTRATAQRLMTAADDSFSQQRWREAVLRYEQVSALSGEYDAALVQTRLNEAYYKAGLALTRSWPRVDAGPEDARVMLRKAQLTGEQRTRANEVIDQIDAYVSGLEAMEDGELATAINFWRSLYDSDPQFLGGYLAEVLYVAYLDLGAQAAGEDKLDYAVELYELATKLGVKDPFEAYRRLAKLTIE